MTNPFDDGEEMLTTPDGEDIPVETPDKILPHLATLEGISATYRLQEGRIEMSEDSDDSEIRVCTSKRDLLDDPEKTHASLMVEHEFGMEADEVYTEFNLSLSGVQELHAVLGDILRYHGRDPL